MLTIKFKAIFIEFLNVVDISFNLPTSSTNSEHKLWQTPKKDVKRIRMFKRMPNVAWQPIDHSCGDTVVPVTQSAFVL